MVNEIQLKVLVCLFGIVVLFSSCSHPLQEPMGQTEPQSEPSNTIASESSAQISKTIAADDFHLEKSDNGVSSVLTGELTPEVTINAQLFCDHDLDNPGAGSVDTAVCVLFTPSDVDLFISPEWVRKSDQTSKENYQGLDFYEQRSAVFSNGAGDTIHISNGYEAFDYRVQLLQYDNLSYLNLLEQHRRIPWYSSDLEWGSDDFSFASETEAFEKLCQYAGRLGITLSPLYKIEYVTPSVIETACRLRSVDDGYDWSGKNWTEEDAAYWIKATQEWNSLPINDNFQSKLFDGTDISGNEYYATNCSRIDFMLNAFGVQDFRVCNIFQLCDKGEEEDIVSLWDALQTLKTHLENPQYELEILYGLPNNDVLIDRIELCYLPVGLTPMGQRRPTELTDGRMDSENGGKRRLYQMIPCWTFRVLWKESGYSFSEYCAVNAITGEYILQTDYIPESWE